MNSIFDGLMLGLKTYIEKLEKENLELKSKYSNLIEEIRNENYNSISESGLESGQKIFTIGDSHSIFFYKSKKIIALWGGSKHEFPLTIYKLSKSFLEICDVPKILGRGHEKNEIKENDFVLFNYGSNDMQKNIYLYGRDDWKNSVKSLMIEYTELIFDYKKKNKFIPIISSIYPNPLLESEGQNTYGTAEERNMYIKFANFVIKNICNENNILYLDIYDFIADEKGFIKREYSNDFIHLDPDNVLVRNYVETKLIDLCKSWSSI